MSVGLSFFMRSDVKIAGRGGKHLKPRRLVAVKRFLWKLIRLIKSELI